MADVNTYDAGQVAVIVGTRAANGLAEGSFVKVRRDVEAFIKKAGADGEITRSKTNNKGGQIEITLDASSDFNDYLSELAALDEATGNGIVSSSVVDRSGTTAVFARQSWIQKVAEIDMGRDSGERTWILDCGDIDIFIGGN